QVAVVLLVAAVELHQALVLERQRAGDRVGQPFDQRAPQPAAAGLDVFDGGMAHGGSGFARCAPSSACGGGPGWGRRGGLPPPPPPAPPPPPGGGGGGGGAGGAAARGGRGRAGGGGGGAP